MGHTAKGIFMNLWRPWREHDNEWSNGLDPTRNDRSAWTYQDIGIFLADAVAEGDWSVLDDILGVYGYLPAATSSTDDIL